MATTNYSLPTLESTALFDLVTDYNALANATDAALAQVAGLVPTETITEMEGQITALQSLTGAQTSNITSLQSQMTTANGNISALQSGLETANSNIGKLQNGLQSTNSNLSSLSESYNSQLNFTAYEKCAINSGKGAISGATIDVLINPTKTLFKLVGQPTLGKTLNGSVARIAIPGLNGWYGFKVTGCPTFEGISEAIAYKSAGIAFADRPGNDTINQFWGGVSVALGTDGYLYLNASQTQNTGFDFNNFWWLFPQVLLSTNNSQTSITESGINA